VRALPGRLRSLPAPAPRRCQDPAAPSTTRPNGRAHSRRWWFRRQVWLPAIEAAELTAPTTVHGLRHAHASWLLAGGADIQVVKERLGHSSIMTTQKYLGTLDETDETAIDALSKIRNRSARSAIPA